VVTTHIKLRAFFIGLNALKVLPLNALVKYGLVDGDEVYFLFSSGEKAFKAINEFKSFVSAISLKIALRMVEVPLKPFEDGVIKVLEALLEAKEREIIMNLAGASKLLAIEAFMAAMLSGLKIQVEIGDNVEIMLYGLESVKLKDKDKRFLKAIENDKEMLSSIAAKAGLTRLNAYRTMIHLEQIGLIITEKKGKIRLVTLTPIGKILSLAKGLTRKS